MMIGIIADTHDNIDGIDEAVEILNSREVGVVVHAGDVISPFAAARFKALNSPIRAVYGNNDGERTGLKAIFDGFGGVIDDFLSFEIDKKRFGVYHGTIGSVQNGLIKSKLYDVVVSGHTHEPKAERVDGVLHINPGEACGYLTGKRRLSILDLKTMESETVKF